MGTALPWTLRFREIRGVRLSAAGLAGLALVAAFVALGWGVVVRSCGPAWGLIDLPNDRSSHSQPRPRAGGIGIALGATSGLLWAAGTGVGLPWENLVAVALGGGLCGVGFIDDRRDLPVKLRLVAQVIAAVALVAMLDAPGNDSADSAWLLAPLAILVVVGMTNVFNFMDGIDGIAGATALAVAATWVLLGWAHDLEALVLIGTTVGGACAGFLVLNWSPARVFMGDSGSLFLGFLAAAVPVVLATDWLGTGLLAAAPLLPFAVDGTATMARRARAGDPLTEAHRSHLYQRAAIRLGHAPVAAGYAGLSAVIGVVGARLVSPDTENALYYTSATAIVVGSFWLVGSRLCR